ncbi:MAG: ABC transporter ATP-binding protein [Clostridia bacterium]|nr:ABC transporter ATP-binding protein [Clostridia bacterium]
MKKVIVYLKYAAGYLALSVIFLIVQALSELILPSMMSEIVDIGVIGMSGKDGQLEYIIIQGLKMLGVALLCVFAAIGVNFFSTKASSIISKRMRHDVFKRVTSFSNTEFDKFSTASLITRTTNDIQQVQQMLSGGVRMLCFAPIMGVGSITLALMKSTSMSWILAVAVGTLLMLIVIGFSAALPKIKIIQSLIDRLNLVSRENLSGMMVIRAFGNELHEEKRFEGANNNLRKTNLFIQRVISLLQPFMTIIMNFTQIAIVWLGSKAIIDSTLEIGDMMAYIQYAMHVIMSFLFISMIFINIPRAMVSINRVGAILETEPSINNAENALKLGSAVGRIEFDNVSFKYKDADDCVLENISFTALPGQTTAFIGSTGSGKSTLINLIPRFYDVTEGSIRFDGTDIRQIDLHSLRENIGYVPQKGVLFKGTVESNLKIGNENADTDTISSALTTAQARFVADMEDGINSEIAQGGTNVSGGQRQRLAIARALVQKSPVYIFDDSFSALDLKTDAALRKALKGYTKNSTVLIVAQRVSTIMNAEQIIVLDEGRIVGKGTHRELLKTCTQYREIAESQLAKEELE